MTNLDSVLKSKDITLLTKVHIVKAMVFLVVMYQCESWTIKKAECQRTDAFQLELWCWRRLLREWSNQSILKEISPEYSFEGLMLKLKLQYFGHLMWRADSFEKTLMLGKIEGRQRRWLHRMRWLDGITDSVDMSLNKLWEMVKDRELVCCSPWGCKESYTTEWLNNKIVTTGGGYGVITVLQYVLQLRYNTESLHLFTFCPLHIVTCIVYVCVHEVWQISTFYSRFVYLY